MDWQWLIALGIGFVTAIVSSWAGKARLFVLVLGGVIAAVGVVGWFLSAHSPGQSPLTILYRHNEYDGNTIYINYHFMNKGQEPVEYVVNGSSEALYDQTPNRAEIDSVGKSLVERVTHLPVAENSYTTVQAGDTTWFTVTVPDVSKKRYEAYLHGSATFFFAAHIVTKGYKPIDLCNYLAGGNPNTIFSCQGV